MTLDAAPQDYERASERFGIVRLAALFTVAEFSIWIPWEIYLCNESNVSVSFWSDTVPKRSKRPNLSATQSRVSWDGSTHDSFVR
jgi:hypothetical protein